MRRAFSLLSYRFAQARLARCPAMRALNRQIDEARSKHKPVKHLFEARRALVHASLAGRG